jgi:hypothetical protein
MLVVETIARIRREPAIFGPSSGVAAHSIVATVIAAPTGRESEETQAPVGAWRTENLLPCRNIAIGWSMRPP